MITSVILETAFVAPVLARSVSALGQSTKLSLPVILARYTDTDGCSVSEVDLSCLNAWYEDMGDGFVILEFSELGTTRQYLVCGLLSVLRACANHAYCCDSDLANVHLLPSNIGIGDLSWPDGIQMWTFLGDDFAFSEGIVIPDYNRILERQTSYVHLSKNSSTDTFSGL